MQEKDDKKDPNKVRIGKTNKRKGSGWERQVAKDLMKKFHDILKPDEEFKSAPRSGGWSKRNKRTFGDLVCPDWFAFVISCKNVQGFNLTTLISKGSMPKYFIKYWKETTTMSKRTGKKPLLVVNIKQKGSLVIFLIDGNEKLFERVIKTKTDFLIYDCMCILRWNLLFKFNQKHFFIKERMVEKKEVGSRK